MDAYEAIFVRKSTRKFKNEPLPESTAKDVRALVDGAERLFPEIDMRVEIVIDGGRVRDARKGIVGGFGKIEAPHYLVITSEDKPGYRENVGYTLEQVVLGMTARGMATCWIGGNVDWESVKRTLAIPAGQVPVIMIAFGLPLQDGFRKEPADAKRKALSRIVSGNPGETWAEALEAARMAPSAGNSQPWRLMADEGRIDVYMARGNAIQQRIYGSINHVDMGVVLCHIILGARHSGMHARIACMPAAEQKDLLYITSIVMA